VAEKIDNVFGSDSEDEGGEDDEEDSIFDKPLAAAPHSGAEKK
jgi:hypothetical protein